MTSQPCYMKLCSVDLRTFNNFQLGLGTNRDIYPYDPTLREKGGLHFCEKAHVVRWVAALDYTHVCDVIIPDNAQVTHGELVSKADIIILSNHRALVDWPEYADLFIKGVHDSVHKRSKYWGDIKTHPPWFK